MPTSTRVSLDSVLGSLVVLGKRFRTSRCSDSPIIFRASQSEGLPNEMNLRPPGKGAAAKQKYMDFAATGPLTGCDSHHG